MTVHFGHNIIANHNSNPSISANKKDAFGRLFCWLGEHLPRAAGRPVPYYYAKGEPQWFPLHTSPSLRRDDCLYVSGVFFVGAGVGINRSNPGGFSLAAHIFAH